METTAGGRKSLIAGKNLWNKRQRVPRIKQCTDAERRKRPFGVIVIRSFHDASLNDNYNRESKPRIIPTFACSMFHLTLKIKCSSFVEHDRSLRNNPRSAFQVKEQSRILDCIA